MILPGRQLGLVDMAVRRAYDVDAALVPDMQGIGSGPDVMSPRPKSASPPARGRPPYTGGYPLALSPAARGRIGTGNRPCGPWQ
jgi:hypothetical protein